VSVDDVMSLFPGEVPTRIRSIQSHELTTDTIGPGNRTALNMVGIEREAIDRGAMLGSAGHWQTTSRFTADVRTVRSLDAPLREQGSFHLHVGSGSWPVRIRLLEAETLEGSGALLVDLPEALPLKVGDRFILREVGRQAVVAGGRILDPSPPRRVRETGPMLPSLRAAGGPDSAATALLEARGQVDLAALSAETGGGRPSTGLLTERRGYSDRRITQLGSIALRLVEDYHAANPLRPGVPKASLAERLRVPTEDLETILNRIEGLHSEGATVRDARFGGGLDGPAAQEWKRVEQTMMAAGYGPPRRKELELDREVLHALIRSGKLIEISDELVYLPATLDEVVSRTRQMPAGFTVADFRDAMGITRKYAVPLLEWMDTTGVTRRDGEGRTLR
jgi:selenocysteine-specific elongation factor